MRQEVHFLHTADLHLDSPFKGLKDVPEEIFKDIKESTFNALDELVQTGIEKQVDFILIAGDLFDNEKQSLKAQIHLKKAFEMLQKENISVFLSYGNHDYINGNIHNVTYPDNVFIFPDEEVRSFVYKRDGIPLASVSGFSYMNRAVVENKTKEYTVVHDEAAFHIAMLHGSVQGDKEHAVYAPFQLSELAAKDFDYWALGHIHKRAVIKDDPPIVYPGNTQGRHRKETGEKGCYHVTLSKTSASLSFIPLQQLLFTPVEVDVSELTMVHKLEKMVRTYIEKQAANVPQLIDLTLYSNNELLLEWEMKGQLEELIEVINEGMATETPWQFIFRTSIKKETQAHSAKRYGEHFFSELHKQIDERKIQDDLTQLYGHKRARRYLDTPDKTIEKEIREEARTRLTKALLKGDIT